MSKTESRTVLGSHFWRGIYSWFARGGIISGPPEVLSAFGELLQRDAERTILILLDEILPYSLLFDEIYLPPMQDMGLSEGLKKDMAQCLGVKVISKENLEEFKGIGREKAEHHLSAITSRNDAADLISRLYRIAGPFAGDYPDLLPVLHSMDAAVYVSRSLNARLNCRAMELGILEIVAENSVRPSVDERVEIVQQIFQAHNLPIVTLDAFRNEKGVVDLDRMFSGMECLRKNKDVGKFRRKISEIGDLPARSIKEVIAQELVQDLRTTLEEYVLSPDEIGKRLATAVLTDVIGMLVPVPTGTVIEGISMAREKKRSASLEWRLFVFEYGDVVSYKNKVYSTDGPFGNLEHVA